MTCRTRRISFLSSLDALSPPHRRPVPSPDKKASRSLTHRRAPLLASNTLIIIRKRHTPQTESLAADVVVFDAVILPSAIYQRSMQQAHFCDTFCPQFCPDALTTASCRYSRSAAECTPIRRDLLSCSTAMRGARCCSPALPAPSVNRLDAAQLHHRRDRHSPRGAGVQRVQRDPQRKASKAMSGSSSRSVGV